MRACSTQLTHCIILKDLFSFMLAFAVLWIKPLHPPAPPLADMTQHTLVKQTETLGGIYKAAFLKIFDLLEDSGWALKPEGKEGEADEDSVSSAPADSGLGSYGGQH